MLNAQHLSSRHFNLEGTLIGFLGGKANKPKSLILEVEQEQLTIQLPKELRSHVQHYLRLGDRVACVGATHVDYKAGIIKLKAAQVFCLTRPTMTTPQPASSEASPCATRKHCPNSASKTSAKILVCRKSGCQKRAGQAVVAAVEQALKDYQLEGQVKLQYTGCQKRCSQSPSLTIMPGKHRYSSLKPKHVPALIEEHFCPSE